MRFLRRIDPLLVVLAAVYCFGCGPGGGGGSQPTGSTIDQSVPTDASDAYSDIYEGPQATQVGVLPGVLKPATFSLLHGSVADLSSQALAGVKVAIAGHPEYGHTLTSPDGRWTMAVNGGTQLAVQFDLLGFASAQRHVPTGWRGQYEVDKVLMVPRSSLATTIASGAATSTLVSGAVSSDADGSRQALLYVPPGTNAQARLRDGTARPLPFFTVRSTEYTVGPQGPQRMPADLAGNIAYTYAIEYVCDEAEALGAKSVEFSTPVAHYVDNFLRFPVGGSVPTGYYDFGLQAWVASDDGRVVKVLRVEQGKAVLSVSSSGAQATAQELAALGVTDDERTQLASMHGAGAELWRVRLSHLTPWDCNWPYGPPAGAEAPNQPVPGDGEVLDAQAKDPDCARGSVILVQDPTLVESVEIPGTGLRLVYRSDRAPGYVSRTRVQLTGSTLPPGVRQVEYSAEVAGRRFSQTFAPTINLRQDLVWDGLDFRGRRLQGKQPVRIRIGYVYDAEYQEPAARRRSFGQFSGRPITGSRSRQQITLWQQIDGKVGGFDAGGVSLGGWTIEGHNVYDADARTLLRGDGSTEARRKLDEIVVDTFAGKAGDPGYAGDGQSVSTVRMANPTCARVAPDGSVWFLEGMFGGFRSPGTTPRGALRRIGVDGVVTKIAGGASAGFGGDGGPAVLALLNNPHWFDFAPDGSAWIADTDNHCIRRIGTDGVITTVAGRGGVAGSSGDDGPATGALMNAPTGIAIDAEGTAYVAEYGGHRIRRIGVDGTITTILGNGQSVTSGNGVAAAEARTHSPEGIAVDREGSVYFTEIGGHIIRKIGIDGRVVTIAGNGTLGHAGDGRSALQARIKNANGLSIGNDGALYFCEWDEHCVRRIAPDGSITTVFGTPGSPGAAGDRGEAKKATCRNPNAACVGPDGTIYVAETHNHIIRRIRPAWPGYGNTDKQVLETDGSVAYVFDRRGRHLRTEHPLTQEALVHFDYDRSGRLIRIGRESGDVVIERNSAGQPLAIRSPSGRRTTLQIGAGGMLSQLQFPDGRTVAFTYAAGGLLTGKRLAGGQQQLFEYDSAGRLSRDVDASGYRQTLTKSVSGDREEVTITTGVGRARRYASEPGPEPAVGSSDGIDVRRTNTTCCETVEIDLWTDGTTETRAQTGVTARQTYQDDKVFGAEVRVPSESKLTVPSAPVGATTVIRTDTGQQATLLDQNDPRSLQRLVTTHRQDGVAIPWSEVFDRSAKTVVKSSPVGRASLTSLDDRLRVVETIALAPGSLAVSYAYDSNGRLASTVQGTGSTQRRVVYGYDGDGYLTQVTDPNGDVMRTTLDASGRPLTVTINGLPGPVLGYDASGRLATVTPPGRPSHRLDRDAAGRLVGYTPPGGARIRFDHDADGLATGVDLAGIQAMQVTYEPGKVRPSAITPGAPRAQGSISFSYDATTGMMTSASTPEGVVTGLAYRGDLPRQVDLSVAGVTAPRVQVVYDERLQVQDLQIGASIYRRDYDLDGLLTAVGDEGLGRDIATGRLTNRTLSTCRVDYGYSGFSELSRIHATKNSATLLDVNYVRDNAGRIVTMSSPGVSDEYHYDLRGRLDRVTRNGAQIASWSYDANSNVTQETRVVNGAQVSRSFGTNAQDQLVTAGNVSYEYDAAGRLSVRRQGAAVTRYTYDVFGNLLTVDLPSGSRIEYLVDAFNRRVRRTVNGQSRYYAYDHVGRLVADSQDGANWRHFIYGTRSHVPDYMRDGAINFMIVYDHLGSVRRVVHSITGAVVQSIDYDVWGNVVADSAPGFQPFGWAGGLADADTGLLRFGARDYSPEMMRWTARDPALFGGGTENLYQYCKCDPGNYVDRYGLVPRHPEVESVESQVFDLFFGNTKDMIELFKRDSKAFNKCVENEWAQMAFTLAYVPFLGGAAIADAWLLVGVGSALAGAPVVTLPVLSALGSPRMIKALGRIIGALGDAQDVGTIATGANWFVSKIPGIIGSIPDPVGLTENIMRNPGWLAPIGIRRL